MAIKYAEGACLVFEGPTTATRKKPELSRTELEKTEPLSAVVCGSQPVATTVLLILNNMKTNNLFLRKTYLIEVDSIYHIFCLFLLSTDDLPGVAEIGRASCRERV